VTGDLHGALETLETALALVEALGDPIRAGDILRMMGRLHWELADRQAAMEDYRRALDVLGQGPETVERARAVSAISQAHMVMIDFDQAIEWGERALELAERLDAQDVIVHALNNIGTSRTLVHGYDQERGLAMQRDSLGRARALDLPYEIGRACYNLAESLFGLGRYAEARPLFEELYAYGVRINSALFTGLGLRLLIELDWKTGRWGAALARRAEAVAGIAGTTVVWQGTILAEMSNDLGQADAAREDMEQMFAQTAKVDQIQTLVPCLGQLARAYDALGREEEAAATIRQYLEMVDQNPYLHWVCEPPLLFACRWHAEEANPEALDVPRACVQRLERAYAQMRSPRTAAALAEGSALVALAAGDLDQALAHSRAAVADWEALGHPYDCARALGDLSRVLELAGEVGPAGAARDRARQLIAGLAEQLEEGLRKSFLPSQGA
jgi:tetratricopeptide (TPR) repeat protein